MGQFKRFSSLPNSILKPLENIFYIVVIVIYAKFDHELWSINQIIIKFRSLDRQGHFSVFTLGVELFYLDYYQSNLLKEYSK